MSLQLLIFFTISDKYILIYLFYLSIFLLTNVFCEKCTQMISVFNKHYFLTPHVLSFFRFQLLQYNGRDESIATQLRKSLQRSMKFTSNLIPYLSFKVALLPSTSAFIEPEIETQSIVAQASFVDTASLSSADTAFFSTAENEVPASFSADFAWVEERLGLIPGATKVDARSGKMVSLDLKKPILPGDGVGNHLLWSVGPSTRDGKEGAPVDKKEWSRLGVEAVKVSFF